MVGSEGTSHLHHNCIGMRRSRRRSARREQQQFRRCRSGKRRHGNPMKRMISRPPSLASRIAVEDEFGDANPAQLAFLLKTTHSRFHFLSVDVPLELGRFVPFKMKDSLRPIAQSSQSTTLPKRARGLNCCPSLAYFGPPQCLL